MISLSNLISNGSLTNLSYRYGILLQNRGKNASQPDERIAKVLLTYQDSYNTINLMYYKNYLNKI